ncbi:MAG: YraN family protein [Gemmatimonadetes bacterium]|nr:YraN family protein [Gemmatimonadota bacterium]
MTSSDTLGTGRAGEGLVRSLYQSRGWRCVNTNYRAGPKEIDLVVRKGAEVAFVEVKTRAASSGGGPLEQVGPRKIARVTAAARHWIHHRGARGERYRFDVAGVYLGARETTITIIHDAWRLS